MAKYGKFIANPSKVFTLKDIKKPNKYNKNWFTIRVNDKISLDLSKFDDGNYKISYRTGLQSLSDGKFIADFWKKAYTLTEVKQILVDYANHYTKHEYFPHFNYLYD